MSIEEAIKIIETEWKCIDRNDGIHCDRKCENCDLVMEVNDIREAYNMAINALETSCDNCPLSAEGDLISRKAVIQLTREMISAEEYGLMDLLDEVKKLPTIPQTETNEYFLESLGNGQVDLLHRDKKPDLPITFTATSEKAERKKRMRLIDADKEIEKLKEMKLTDEKDKQSVRFAIIVLENATTIPQTDFSKTNEDIIAELKNREALEPLCEAVRKVSEKVAEMVTSEEFVNLLKEEAEPQTNTAESFVKQEDVADIMNEIESALSYTDYTTVGYDNTDTFLKVLIDRKIGEKKEKTNTAEWIFPELVTGRYKCSHCRGNADRTTRFCPYCGYLMSNYNGKAE